MEFPEEVLQALNQYRATARKTNRFDREGVLRRCGEHSSHVKSDKDMYKYDVAVPFCFIQLIPAVGGNNLAPLVVEKNTCIVREFVANWALTSSG